MQIQKGHTIVAHTKLGDGTTEFIGVGVVVKVHPAAFDCRVFGFKMQQMGSAMPYTGTIKLVNTSLGTTVFNLGKFWSVYNSLRQAVEGKEDEE